MGFNDTTLAIPPALKEEIKSLKIFPRETYAEVLRRLIDDAAKVPELEKKNSELQTKVKELENEIERIELQHEVDMTEYDTGDDEQ